MSLNWVMLDQRQSFVRLPGEDLIYTAPPRTSLSLTTPRSYPGNNPLSIKASVGNLYLTNQRILYLPTPSSPQFQSFACPLNHLHDTHLSTPFFGPNGWRGIVQPVPGGGLPTSQAHIEILFTFKDGGAFDFHNNFEQIKERYLQAVAASQGSHDYDTANGVIMSAVHLEDLPRYQDAGHDRLADESRAVDPSRQALGHGTGTSTSSNGTTQGSSHVSRLEATPQEAPPGYEETQRQGLQREIDSQFSKQA